MMAFSCAINHHALFNVFILHLTVVIAEIHVDYAVLYNLLFGFIINIALL